MNTEYSFDIKLIIGVILMLHSGIGFSLAYLCCVCVFDDYYTTQISLRKSIQALDFLKLICVV
jgi:hypothetical protein